MIREYQTKGHLVAMIGDGTNDAPALAQADVAVAMNTGTQAAKEAGNMVDLDSNPTKLLAFVEIGKQMVMTRGALTTFSIANDVAKYFVIIPAAFAATYPQLGALDVMRLGSPTSAIMSAVICNALIIVALIPLALRGIRYRPAPAAKHLSRNLLVYGLGGEVAERVAALHAAGDVGAPPVVTASASGLPHISPEAARYQAAWVARLRNLPVERVEALIAAATEKPTLGILGAERVHALTLSQNLDNGE